MPLFVDTWPATLYSGKRALRDCPCSRRPRFIDIRSFIWPAVGSSVAGGRTLARCAALARVREDRRRCSLWRPRAPPSAVRSLSTPPQPATAPRGIAPRPQSSVDGVRLHTGRTQVAIAASNVCQSRKKGGGLQRTISPNRCRQQAVYSCSVCHPLWRPERKLFVPSAPLSHDLECASACVSPLLSLPLQRLPKPEKERQRTEGMDER